MVATSISAVRLQVAAVAITWIVAGALGAAAETSIARVLAAATALASASWLAMAGPQNSLRTERRVWSAFRQAVLFITCAFGLELAAHEAVARGVISSDWLGVAFTAGTAAAGFSLYRALVRWNRVGTVVSDPSDWLNGISGVAAAMALTNVVLELSHPPLVDVPWWMLQGWIMQFCVLVVLCGTTGTVLSLAGIARDRRGLSLAAALAIGIALQITGVVAASSGTDGRALLGVPALATATALAWSLLAIALGITSRMARPPLQPAREATAEATTAGAIVVLMSSVVILAIDGLTTDGSTETTVVMAAIAAGISAVRVLHQVDELSEVARSRAEARTDYLTGLANRRRLVELVSTAVRDSVPIVVMVIDLDRFKDMNDRHGHAFGDALITAIARRLQGTAGDRGTLARPGGDEFALLMRAQPLDHAVAVAGELLSAMREPIEVEGRFVRLDASIGVASSETSGHEAADVFRCADAAMYVSKRAGGGISVYDAADDARERAEQSLADEMRTVLTQEPTADGSRIVLAYQPQVEVTTGRVIGVEALARWQHPQRGLLTPADFLHLVENRGLMDLLTIRVLSLAAAEAARWRARSHGARLAVNVSASSLLNPELPRMLDDALATSGLTADALVVEITETSLMLDPDTAVSVTRLIVGRGIDLSIDDYGTGHSSLAYLNRLPASELKLDRSFTQGLLTDARTAAIVAGTIELAHHLGLRLAAEGVEDRATLDELAALGCDITQGYLHTRPLPAEEIHRWLDAHAGGA